MICALIAAAGSGTRTGLKENKIFFEINGEPMIKKTVDVFLKHERVDAVYVIHSERDEKRLKEILGDSVMYVRGGSTRSTSVFNGLKAILDKYETVLVHDGARPFVDSETIDGVIDAINENTGVVAGVRVTDTVKETDGTMKVVSTPERSRLWAAQTPQGFLTRELYDAYVYANGKDFTDDAAVFEFFGKNVVMAESKYSNKKITTAEDIKMPDTYLSGIGYDVHRLAENRKLILGGVEIPYEKGLDGHSDADVVIHAIMDAMLGAASLGDIGRHFPDNDERYKGISSILLLKHVVSLLSERGFKTVNISAVIVAQKPKLKEYIMQMNKNIADAVGISTGRVNVAATTTEKLGFEGREEGISSTATVMLVK